jgi:hypothetical protein
MSAKQKGGSKNDATDKHTQALRELQVSINVINLFFLDTVFYNLNLFTFQVVKWSSFLQYSWHNRLLDEFSLQARCAENKLCFECRQRGPTYVDMTIGSFVCSKCSGVLRGITPPHRIKSISMSSFSTEEVESIRTRGENLRNCEIKKEHLLPYQGSKSD